jgi:hypothetical protein
MVDQLQFAWITLVALRYLSWDYHGRCRGKREAEILTLTDLRNRQPVQELGIRLARYADPKAL